MFRRHQPPENAGAGGGASASPGGAIARVAALRRDKIGSANDVGFPAADTAEADTAYIADAADADIAEADIAETSDADAVFESVAFGASPGSVVARQSAGWVPDRHVRGTSMRRSRAADDRRSRAARGRRRGRRRLRTADTGAAPWREVDLPDIGATEAESTDDNPASDSHWAQRVTGSGPWGELAEKWVPETLRGARVDPGRRGTVLLTVVAAIAAVVAAVGVWWAKPEPVPVTSAGTGSAQVTEAAGADASVDGAERFGVPKPAAAGDERSQGAPPDPAGHATQAEPDGKAELAGPILVSVTGQVRNPGLVTVPAGARVADAIAAAGGVADEAQLTGLNLAAHLADGASVVVGGSGGSSVVNENTAPAVDAAGSAPSGGGTQSGRGDLINLNTADSTALQTLAGVGPVTAEAIIAYRADHGPFTDLAQLQEVSGIGPATFARLKPHVTL